MNMYSRSQMSLRKRAQVFEKGSKKQAGKPVQWSGNMKSQVSQQQGLESGNDSHSLQKDADVRPFRGTPWASDILGPKSNDSASRRMSSALLYLHYCPRWCLEI